MSNSKPLFSNSLIHESSPYLLQHAHNPVNWYAWNTESLAKAKAENKPLLISIGYSACHWCHVMEKECFEKEEVAALMNEYFICIKIDREERPDIDQIYMSAVQLMTGSGGWPLNCFALPDGRPIYGGTYFPAPKWKQVLLHINNLIQKDFAKVEDYASRLTEGIVRSELIEKQDTSTGFSIDTLENLLREWEKRFDFEEGGPDKAPKFSLPNNYQFLLRYANFSKSKTILNHVELTLTKMAYGGIYDQLGGGFARYSVDYLWKVPHFEKMLYDNAQLVSLYSEAFQATKNPLYQQVVEETLNYVERELSSPEGGFYSAEDADSEGVEGKYYVWTKKELEQSLGVEFDLFSTYYNVNEIGYWEEENYILLRKKSVAEISKLFEISEIELKERIKQCKKDLLAIRSKRIKPGLDDKILCSWNALMIKGYTDAYRVFGNANYLLRAEKAIRFIEKYLMLDAATLFHNYKNGKATINGFLEDYSFLIEAYIALYEASFDETYLQRANKLLATTLADFYDSQSGFFFFTSSKDAPLIARKMETSDNVIPASNSSLAKSLFYLGHYFYKEEYIKIAQQMLQNVSNIMQRYGSGYSNWAVLFLHQIEPFYEIAIVGENCELLRKELETHYFPNKLLLGARNESDLPLLKNKLIKEKTMVYVCENKTCHLPVETTKEALLQIKK
jgi:uncharacterized protein YyaL (SSP411 family)